MTFFKLTYITWQIDGDQLSKIRRYPWSVRNMKLECHVQLAFTCTKLTIETLEQGVKYVQS